MGAILYVIEAGTYFFALRHIPSGLVALLLYLYPAPVAIASWLLFQEKLGTGRVIALILAMLGSAFTVVPALTGASGGPPGGSPTLGVVLGVSCAISYSVYMLMGGHITRKSDPLAVTTLVCLSAAVVFSLWATLGQGWHLPHTPKGWAGIGLLSIFSTVIAILCVLAGLKRLGSVRASTISTLEAAATVAVGGIFLHERLTFIQFVGGALILLGAIICARAKQVDPPPVTCEE
jgi:drug/metabolite transporter (DMT)-like permease